VVTLWIPWVVSSKKSQASRDSEAWLVNQEKTAAEERRSVLEEQNAVTESKLKFIGENLNKDLQSFVLVSNKCILHACRQNGC